MSPTTKSNHNGSSGQLGSLRARLCLDGSELTFAYLKYIQCDKPVINPRKSHNVYIYIYIVIYYGDIGNGLLFGLPHCLPRYSRMQPFCSSNSMGSAQVQTTFPKRTAPRTRTGVNKYDSRLVFKERWKIMKICTTARE